LYTCTSIQLLVKSFPSKRYTGSMAHASTKGDIPRREFHGSKAYFGRFASRMCRSAQYLDQEYPYIDYGTNEGGNDSGGDPIRASVMPFKQQDSPDNKWNPCIWPIVIPIIDSKAVGAIPNKQRSFAGRTKPGVARRRRRTPESQWQGLPSVGGSRRPCYQPG